jgi:Co/Zn/Cd efflux system component
VDSQGDKRLRRAVALVGLLNVAYFFVEFGLAHRLGSVSLFADSIDFLEDAAISGLIFVGLGLSLAARSRLGVGLSGIMLVPSAFAAWSAVQKFLHPLPPDAAGLGLVASGALAVNLGCAFILARHRHGSGSLTKAAFLSARNDAFANVAMIAAGLITSVWVSAWPDLAVGVGILILNADAAVKVFKAARAEREAGVTRP